MFHSATSSIRSGSSTEDIPRESFFEVTASTEAMAESRLAEQAVVLLDRGVIRHYGQEKFQCLPSSQPYLARAVYQNGGSGDFSIKIAGSALVVGYMSLGTPSSMHRSALVVCLRFQPTEVFHALGGAI
jgi:hypothetical protein